MWLKRQSNSLERLSRNKNNCGTVRTFPGQIWRAIIDFHLSLSQITLPWLSLFSQPSSHDPFTRYKLSVRKGLAGKWSLWFGEISDCVEGLLAINYCFWRVLMFPRKKNLFWTEPELKVSENMSIYFNFLQRCPSLAKSISRIKERRGRTFHFDGKLNRLLEIFLSRWNFFCNFFCCTLETFHLTTQQVQISLLDAQPAELS